MAINLDKIKIIKNVPTIAHTIYIYGFSKCNVCYEEVKFSFHKLIPKNTQMTILYTNLSLYITFTIIYYIRQE